MGFYKDKATERLDKLRGAIDSNEPDTIVVKKVEDVQPQKAFFDIFSAEGYVPSLSYEKKGKYFKELVHLLKKEDTGFDYTEYTPLVEYTIRSKNQGSVINDAAFSRDGEFIIASSAFKENIPYPKGDPKRVPNNEITWQCFEKATKNPKNLKGLILRDIQTKGTWKILHHAYEKMGFPLDKKAVWKPDPKDPVMDDLFKTIVGSDNISGKLLILQNHHQALGNKEVTKVITWTKKVEGSNSKLTMFVGLSDKK